MRIVAISTEDDAPARYLEARAQGYITFIYEHADPLQTLTEERFMYVNSDQELLEKTCLVHADASLADELLRL